MKKVFVSFILDETGSMQLVKGQTIEGFNEYLETLKAEKNDIRFTLTKFNSDKVDIVCENVRLKEVKLLNDETYQPSALTPLYDAIGQTIRSLETKLKKKQNALIVIQTDGLENHSKEFNRDSIFSLVDEKKKVGWTFLFLGADQDAWLVGQTLGLDKGNVVSYASVDTKKAFQQAAAATSCYSRSSGKQSKDLWSEAEEPEH